jgi:hypothetical protein
MLYEIESPRPVPIPTPFVVKPGSNIFGILFGDIPWLLSEKIMYTFPLTYSVLILRTAGLSMPSIALIIGSSSITSSLDSFISSHVQIRRK